MNNDNSVNSPETHQLTSIQLTKYVLCLSFTNATGEWLAYHTESIKRTNMYGNRSISSPDVRNFYGQLSSVTSFHDSAMSDDVTTRCQKSYYREQSSHRKTTKSWRDNINEWRGQSLSPLLRITDDRAPITQRHLPEGLDVTGVYLACYLGQPPQLPSQIRHLCLLVWPTAIRFTAVFCTVKLKAA